jgi:hypothetical protein
MMKILSLGAGVQSSAVLLMSCRGMLPKLDAAIFADTQWEPRAVYEWLDNVLEPEAKKAGIPIHRVSKGNIREDAMRSRMRADEYKQIEGGRWGSMPLYTEIDGKVGMTKRQCTKEYKIEPIQRQIGQLVTAAGMKKSVGAVEQWFGISGDEMRRMRMSKVRYITNYYPLVFAFERPWHRIDCLKWLADNGFPQAPRSACIGCPYRSEKEWRNLLPAEFADAVAFDQQIRKWGGLRADTYLHRSCVPLDEVDLSTPEERGQQNWLNECEGMCGV